MFIQKILGTLILFIKESLMEFYESVATYFEFGVAIMLVLLGAQVFYKLFNGSMHIHSHDHDNDHTHLHGSHDHDDEDDDHHDQRHPLLTLFPFFNPLLYLERCPYAVL